ncbi:unnamed protein product [Auanema sp. JU1783]|nr:unnamed protein product [Auanema sp. JU1783]
MGSDDETRSSEVSFVLLGASQKTVLFDKLREAADKYERHVHYPDVHYLTVRIGDHNHTVELTDPGMARTGGREMAIKKADIAILYYSAPKLSTMTQLHSLKEDLERKKNMPVRIICDVDDVADYDEEDSSTGISSQSEGYESDPDHELGMKRRRSMEIIRKQSDDGTIAIDMGRQFATELGDRCVFIQISSSTYQDQETLLKELVLASTAKARTRSRSLIPGRLMRRSKSRDTKVAPQPATVVPDYSTISGASEREESPRRRKGEQKIKVFVSSIPDSTKMAAAVLFAFLLVGLVGAQKEGLDEKYTYKQICVVDGKLTVLNGFDCRNQIAVGKWKNSVNATGWTFLEVETKPEYDPELQAYTAGYLEGILSQTVLHYHIENTVADYCTNFTEYCKRMTSFVNENQMWVKKTLETTGRDDIYWSGVNRTFHQLTGLIDGYEGRAINPSISYELHPILLLNWNGDFYDLEKKLNKTRDPITDQTGEKCSGFIKVTPDNADLLISQVTMSGFQNMLRVLKLYKFGYDRALYPGYATSIASYPGLLYSSDDFALMSSGLAIIETTISVFNLTLFNETKAVGQLPTWVRAVVANQMARDAREWCHLYAKYNSGTYNNQWAVLDYNKFEKHKPLAEYGLFYVLEQMPGKIVYSDLTWFLKKYSYFPSYNIPFFKKITDISGFVGQAAKMGDWFKWGAAPRAKIFERDHHNVKDLATLQTLMRYNNYKEEEFSKCKCNPPYSAEAAISARGDLNPANGTYEFPGQGHVNHGALDYKGTNVDMMKNLQFQAQGGPTWGQVPAFKWSEFDFKDKVKHIGHPDEWKFNLMDVKWETNVFTEE